MFGMVSRLGSDRNSNGQMELQLLQRGQHTVTKEWKNFIKMHGHEYSGMSRKTTTTMAAMDFLQKTYQCPMGGEAELGSCSQ